MDVLEGVAKDFVVVLRVCFERTILESCAADCEDDSKVTDFIGKQQDEHCGSSLQWAFVVVCRWCCEGPEVGYRSLEELSVASFLPLVIN
jgi:hypothetical protein